MNRRRSERITACLPFDVFCRTRRLGRFWTHNVSREGIFLHTGSNDCPNDEILELRFRVDGVEYRLRGTVVHRTQGRGMGIQLAYWRRGDQPAYQAYLSYTLFDSLRRAA